MFDVLDLVYPKRCPFCDDLVPSLYLEDKRIKTGALIHAKCRAKIKKVKGATCFKCGKPLQNPEQEYCEDCKRYRHEFVRGFSLFHYRSVAGSIYRFKYMGRQEYALYYAEVARLMYGRRLIKLGIDAIIPVPMYKKKQKKRTYNQAESFAKALSSQLGIPCYTDVIKRVINTRPMKELDIRGRRNNLKKAFIIARNDVKFKCILIIDDIYTTGSTIDEIAHEFLMAGVEKAYFLTLAIGQTN